MGDGWIGKCFGGTEFLDYIKDGDFAVGNRIQYIRGKTGKDRVNELADFLAFPGDGYFNLRSKERSRNPGSGSAINYRGLSFGSEEFGDFYDEYRHIGNGITV